jgi:endoglucanase
MHAWIRNWAPLALCGGCWACGGGTEGTPDTTGGGTESAAPGPGVTPVGPELLGLHVVDQHIETSDGQTVLLHGVNRSGTEYKCVQNGGIFDGPASVGSVQAIATWKANAVRIPLNADCWLGINGVPAAYSGDTYKRGILGYVALLHQFHIVPILDLHWTAPGDSPADRLQPMPDADHAAAFWSDVALSFQGDDGVVFEPYNEPFPDGNRDTDAAWQCWRDGCMARLEVARAPGGNPSPPELYAATGMQALVDAIRGAGASNLILLGGVEYSNALTQWLKYAPSDPLANLGAAWHIYDYNLCSNENCWNGAPSQVAAAFPIVVTELGEGDCASQFILPLLSWLDARGLGYLAWSWNANGACQPRSMTSDGQPWSLVSNLLSGAPNGAYAQAYHDHLQGL